MATDYDSPRKTDDDPGLDNIEELKTRRREPTGGLVDLDEGDHGPIELPGADLSGEELTVNVLPRQADEFTCSSCFLVQHRSRLARRKRGESICQDCT
ncbi:DUF4193 domain-containing protein [Catenulispora sp. GP43]|uniref:DUF4193 domain-containing protein n=1 Tax=Catenulispora sp. GP43 TaxID=3156263 RepID=UPI00351771D4